MIRVKMMRQPARMLLGLLFVWSSVNAQQPADYALIPYPQQLTAGKGSFSVTARTVVVIPVNQRFKSEADLLSGLFKPGFGTALNVEAKLQKRSIRLVYDAMITAPEGYHILITPQQVTLSAAYPAGMFRAVQTIRQLLPAAIENPGERVTEVSLPAVTIRDEPAYAWRGLHLDVSRHFFSINYLERMIDRMALYKFNKFHLHLTDDQGWRVEIKKYPKLTEEGAWRTFNNQDSVCMQQAKDNPDMAIDPAHIVQKNGKTMYGGFYTQEQLKKLVAYAAARHIDIVPEVDMPGHMMAAINAYNYLSCDGKNSVFGELFTAPMCPCQPAVFRFAEDVFTEIMDIFPSKYIHIGGDEVDRTHWEKSDACKQLMAKEGLKNTAELQSYFIREMEKFFNAKGRTLIGWDEILEGGISRSAVIMYWRNWVPEAAVKAAKNGNVVIMSPGEPLYFSNEQDKNSLPSVYYYNPIPKDLTLAERKNIIGGQGNTWAERIPTEQRADYMIYPRMTALAERLWTNKDDYASYLQRLNAHYTRLDRLKVSYRLPDLGLLESYAFTGNTTLTIEKPIPTLTIRFTLDSTLPAALSGELSGPLTISESKLVRVAAFKPDGSRGDVYDLHYRKEELAVPATVAAAANGLACSWFRGSFTATIALFAKTPDGSSIAGAITVPKEAQSPAFGLQYRGYINVPQDGIYTFYLTCDDGGVLKIADRLVVDNDGLHAAKEKNGQVALQKGLQRFALDFIEGGGGYTLKLQYSFNGSAPQDIPAGWFKH
ncbi:MAG: family 20 glycosylhydrolase [Chitinophagaceae bacterium]